MTVPISQTTTGLPERTGPEPSSEPETATAEAPTDAELMARVRRGERDAFGLLVDRHKDGLVAYLARLTGSRERAEDLAQEAFLRLYRAAAGYRERGRLAAFLYRIATNLLRSEERRERRWRLLSPELRPLEEDRTEPGAPARVMRAELRRRLAAALGELPLALRVPLVLYEIEDWPQQDIARVLSCRVGTVKSRLHRARARLRRELGPVWEEWNGGSR
ncbi:MAG: RNA polymerase sigma factor [Acidobacteriota bacterium]|jgi:RNA polymerase sigma-70 factor (ECF subfamily)